MQTVPSFVQSVEIEASVDTVFRFHEREDALTLLTPVFPPVRLVSKTPGIGVGTRVELRIVHFRWVALHTASEENRLFVDEQVEGPFAYWVHRHEFERLGDRARLTDRIAYRLPGGPVLNALLGWAVKPGLRRMFAHRHAVTKRLCENT
jgi:ligand-binding SRPBCC domain-containing protein